MKNVRSMLILAALAASLAAADHDPFAGTWQMNARKSKYPPGTCPRSMIIRMETVSNEVWYSSETWQADGKKTRASYVANYNGTEALVTSANGLMTPVSLKRVDDRTVLASYRRSLQVIATSRRVVSKNGRVMTITTVAMGRNGPVTSIGVYERIALAGTDSVIKSMK
jgi:hypothetical protein